MSAIDVVGLFAWTGFVAFIAFLSGLLLGIRKSSHLWCTILTRHSKMTGEEIISHTAKYGPKF